MRPGLYRAIGRAVPPIRAIVFRTTSACSLVPKCDALDELPFSRTTISEGFFCISMTPSNTVIGGLIVFAAIITAALIRQPRTVGEGQVTHRPIQLEEDGYVSSQTCKTCHPSQVRELAQLLSSDDDPGSDASICPFRLRTGRGHRYGRWADVARTARPGVVGGIRRS